MEMQEPYRASRKKFIKNLQKSFSEASSPLNSTPPSENTKESADEYVKTTLATLPSNNDASKPIFGTPQLCVGSP